MALIYIPKEVSKHGLEPYPMHEIINPEYQDISDSVSLEEEGCHSVR